MAKSATIQIKLESTADTGYYYVTKKNPRNQTEKMEMRKYECIVKNEHQVEYEGKTFYLSPLTQNLLGIVRPIRGQAYWKYNNRLLSDIYEDVHA